MAKRKDEIKFGDEKCVYMIRSVSDPSKVYIGSTKSMRGRVLDHLHNLSANRHVNSRLQNHYNEYGGNDFVFDIIECCDDGDLLIREQYYMDLYNSYEVGFNECPSAFDCTGRKFSEETLIKLRESHLGQESWNRGLKSSEETRRKLRESHLGQKAWNKGVPMKEESKIKLRESLRGKTPWNKGVVGKVRQSDDAKRKKSEKLMGHEVSEETRNKIRERKLGYRQSESAKLKISQSNKGRIPPNKGKKFCVDENGRGHYV